MKKQLGEVWGNMTKYKIGQIITAKNDIVVHTALSDKEILIKKGSQGVVGADNLIHYFSGFIQPFSNNTEIKGYDVDSITEIIFKRIKQNHPYYDDDTDFSDEDFKDIVRDALVSDLGF